MTAVANRMTSWSNNKEEEMYKELFIQLAEGTLPRECVIPSDVTRIARNFFVSGPMPDLYDVTFSGLTSYTSSPVYLINNIKILRCPELTELMYVGGSLVGSTQIEDLFVPKVRRFHATYSFWAWNGDHLNVHIDDLCASIKNYPNFPGTQTDSQFPKITFVGTDGSLNWDGTEWVFTPSA